MGNREDGPRGMGEWEWDSEQRSAGPGTEASLDPGSTKPSHPPPCTLAKTQKIRLNGVDKEAEAGLVGMVNGGRMSRPGLRRFKSGSRTF